MRFGWGPESEALAVIAILIWQPHQLRLTGEAAFKELCGCQLARVFLSSANSKSNSILHSMAESLYCWLANVAGQTRMPLII
jgi:hypothetical protein